jgi:hypothetical protein
MGPRTPAIALAALVLAAAVQADETPPRRGGPDVVDCYLEIPDDFIELVSDRDAHPPTRAERLAAIQARSEDGRYLHVEGEDFVDTLDVRLFEKRDGRPLVALVIDGESVELVHVVEKRDGAWVDVASEVLPRFPLPMLRDRYNRWARTAREKVTVARLRSSAHSLVRLELPREGTTILAVGGLPVEPFEGKELFRLAFDGDRFAIAPD